MKIEYFGHSCFRFTGKDGTSVLTDPYTGVGYELPTGISAQILLVSHGHFDHSATDKVQGEILFNKTGEFSYNGVEIVGVETDHDPENGRLRGKNILFTFMMDGISVCHLGDLGEPYSDEVATKIGGADILLLPIGGTYTIDFAQAKRYADKLSPKMAIPMHYRPKDGALDIATQIPFLEQYCENEIVCANNGEYDTESGLQKILFMERKGG